MQSDADNLSGCWLWTIGTGWYGLCAILFLSGSINMRFTL